MQTIENKSQFKLKTRLTLIVSLVFSFSSAWSQLLPGKIQGYHFLQCNQNLCYSFIGNNAFVSRFSGLLSAQDVNLHVEMKDKKTSNNYNCSDLTVEVDSSILTCVDKKSGIAYEFNTQSNKRNLFKNIL